MEGCIKAIVNSAIRRKFTVSVVKDAVASVTDQKRNESLTKLASNGVTIIDTPKVLEKM